MHLHNYCAVLPLYAWRRAGTNEDVQYLPENERCCYICLDAVESELHVVCHCPVYHDLRDDLFYICQQSDPLFNNMSDERKLAFILSNADVAKNSANILSKMMRRRRGLIFNV